MQADAWTLILAAGAGRRLLPITNGVPKQFWRPFGQTSLLEETLNRFAPLVPARRTVTVIDQSQRQYLTSLADGERLGNVVLQPSDRGTAAGVLLGLVTIVQHAPNAIVILSPSDHGVRNPEAFREGLRAAVSVVRDDDRQIVLLGVEPDCARVDYGWITPSRPVVPLELIDVSGFAEKPAAPDACRLFETGAVWNTMVLTARVRTLIDLYRRWLPGLYAVIAPAAGLTDLDRREYLREVYPTLVPYDFSHDLLSLGRGLSLIVWPSTVGWSDLGTPDRLLTWQAATVSAHLLAPSAA
jgi:mannose-1-phosphate guanylyltransferase